MTITGPSTVTISPGTSTEFAIQSWAQGGAGASVSLNASDVTVFNQRTGTNSVGIYSLASPSVGGNGTLTLSGTNNVTTRFGTSILMNMQGTGSATSTIGGVLIVDSQATNTDDNDGVETTTHQGGAATLNMTATGSITVRGGNGIFIDSLAGGGNVRGNIAPGMTVNLDNTIAGANNSLNPNSGIYIVTQGTGTVDLATGAAIDTQGARADGIRAVAVRGAMNVSNSGPIATTGDNSRGIELTTTAGTNGPGGPITASNTGSIQTQGLNSAGILANSTDGNLSVTNTGPITTTGRESSGIQAVTGNAGMSTIDTGSIVQAKGQYAVGVYALGNTSNVTNEAGGIISGGWQAGTTDTGTAGLPSAGVAIGSRGAGSTLMNNGSIGALSDRAIVELDRYGIGAAEPLTIINNGTITGYVQLGAGDATFRNLTPHSFDIRNFADTNGDGAPDTKRVAISDFGAGTDTFSNESNGVVRLAPIVGAATTDPSGYYVPTTGIDSRPLEASFYDFTREGLLQGQMVNLETFDNAGTIDLRGAALGNTLVITGNAAAGGAAGSGVYISDGGQLLLDTRLNDGIPLAGQTNSYSDILVVDQTQLGAGGATSIGITIDPASAGAVTPGNGIEVVEVRNKAGSADGTFTLGSRAASGAYEYTLYRNGVGADAADGNWYLRSTLPPEPPEPPSPPGPPTPPPDPIPDYRNEVPPDIVLPALANRLGLGMIGTYRDRVGIDYPDPVKPAETIWCKDPTQNFRCTPTAAESSAYADSVQPHRHAVWGRIFGETGDVDFNTSSQRAAVRSLVDNGPSYDFDMWGIQIGADLLRRDNDNGTRDVAGFYLGAGRITSDVDTPFGQRAGSADIDGYSLGAYWTRLAESGWYVDGVLQATWYDANTAAEGRGRLPGESFGTDGWGFAASLETGRPFRITDGWSIEPQAQFIYQHVSLNDDADHFGQFDYGDTDALYGRLGARLARDWTTEAGRRFTAWASTDIWSSFGASADTTDSSLSGANPVTFHTDLGGNWGHVGLGLSGEVAQNVSVFASGDYNFGIGHGDSDSWGGRIGLKVKW
ncbi:autotransporter outer membrane beta-barrel domain-containing protein [Rhizobium calliandrae]|uniref:Autotransporter outer membrane beta-barrel domain-containing protein n=1 Tax=Rhizobium calliandrae TaxID=1312182 RepID=A0ABT7KIW6_9HYPH|nr:autotransporter outer membrane beta-barrel domain-containing protein [Rhizobium calliandrae]MDL2407898.1 autotransporter outer membrane beta-barrel domain-containing protein [Rhizobium calliandrae]